MKFLVQGPDFRLVLMMENKTVEDTNEILKKGFELHQQGNLTKAKELYLKCLQIDHDNVDGLHLLGVCMFQEGDLEGALIHLKSVTTKNPQFGQAFNNLGKVYQAKKDFESAIEASLEAVKIQPENISFINDLIQLYTAVNQKDLALKYIDNSLALDSNQADLHLSKGRLLTQLQHYKDAMQSLRTLLTMQPASLEGARLAAQCLENLGELDQAIHLQMQISKQIKGDEDSLFSLATLYLKTKDLTASVNHYLELLSYHPDNVKAKCNLALAYRQQQKFTQSEQLFKEVLAQNASDPVALQNLALLYWEHGEKAKAHDQIAKAIEILGPQADLVSYQISFGNYAPADSVIKETQKLIEEQIAPAHESLLSYSLGKVFEKAAAKEKKAAYYETAFTYFERANHLNLLPFNYSVDKEIKTINNLMRIYTSDYFTNSQPLNNLYKPIFVLGMPRSGTSLVEQILASHTEVFGAGELLTLSHLVNQAGRIGEYQSVEENCSILDQAALTNLAHEYMLETSKLASQDVRIIDKMPQNFLLIGVIYKLFPKATIIHCKRDPVDTCFSCFKQSFGDSLLFTCSLSDLGIYYQKYQELMQHWVQVLPGFIHEVEYEALIESPETESKKLIEACDLEWQLECLNFHQTKRAVGTASADQVRQPIYKTSVKAWHHYKEQLSPLLKSLSVPSSNEKDC